MPSKPRTAAARAPKGRREPKPAPDLDALLKYRQKRDFERTPEPSSGAAADAVDLTFVVQQHRATRMHWDFRLEVDGVLASWAVPKGPSLDTRMKRMAAHVEDHPFDYGGFEGVIPEGNYGAGEVIVWDNGTYTPDEGGEYSWGDKAEGNRRMGEGIAAGKLSFTLRGKKLHGSWTLVRMGGARKSDGKAWLLIKHRDAEASTRDVLEEDRSVISGLSIRDLQEGRMPRVGADGAAPHPDAREAPFPDAKMLRPMLPTLVAEPFSRAGWIFEPKLDGVRTLAFVRDGKVELRSRRGNVVTVQYPEAVDAMKRQRVESAVFDGEICALDEDGAPDFQILQARINLSRPAEVARAASETPAIFFVFDLLYLNGFDLTGVPCVERKALLRQMLATDDRVRYVDHVEDDGKTLYASAVDLGFEGSVGKRGTSTYEAGVRSQAWLKAKDTNEQEFVIGGYTEGEGARRKTFGGVLVGCYAGDDLRFVASVGSGFTDRTLDALAARLQNLRTDRSPFSNPPTVIGGRWSGGKSARCLWVKPELVARVRFSQWTRDDNLRAPVFKGLRDDIEPRTVSREPVAPQAVDVIADEPARARDSGSALAAIVASVVEQLDAHAKDEFPLDVGGVRIKLTNLNKVFWPATKEHPPRTKRELIRYYARVAPYIVPHLRDRPLTLNRYPNGIDAKNFYQKHWPQAFPKEFRVERAMLYSAQNDADGEYILVNNIETLIWLAQLADIEMHPWMARVNPQPDAPGRPTTFSGSEENIERSVLNYPDFMVFDLDPYIYAGDERQGDEPALNRKAFEKTREVAFALKDLLQQLRLSSFVKTTGKTGLHIFVPVLRQYTYDEIRAATEAVGRFLMQEHPKTVTMEWSVPKRAGKIFFDHNQNARGKTLASEYSARPSPPAAVSAPVTWQELGRVYPTDFDLDTMPERLREHGDIWADILDAKQDLRALLEVTG
ncbi:MAG: non-homologous end-joining DNA ligase [Dehalococcoidia bacterium]|nr:non-homologous end-joining DNA ligase [Dehalococcoidia bacterium]